MSINQDDRSNNSNDSIFDAGELDDYTVKEVDMHCCNHKKSPVDGVELDKDLNFR